jgi:hypothetical protein
MGTDEWMNSTHATKQRNDQRKAKETRFNSGMLEMQLKHNKGNHKSRTMAVTEGIIHKQKYTHMSMYGGSYDRIDP